MKKITLKIITPEKVVSEEEVYQVTLPIEDGEITILPEHISYIGALKAGEVVYRKESAQSDEIALAVSGGFVEFHDNVLTLLADTAEYADAIDIARAQEAKERAEKLMRQDTFLDSEEYARIAASLEKQLTRIRVARKHHAKHRAVPEVQV
ncbi:MAG: ATP synthase F1 subunit epsilon [Candidatus Moranbacteria bacterium]|nr:ATP synthase F1 subunit epsilon [Candidatus Moranbacteria bacterium]